MRYAIVSGWWKIRMLWFFIKSVIREMNRVSNLAVFAHSMASLDFRHMEASFISGY